MSIEIEGRRARLTGRLDEDTARFEQELCAQVDLSLTQRHDYLRACRGEFRLFQMHDRDGRPAMQVALQVLRPSRLRRLGRAIAHRMGPATRPEEERAGLRILRRLCEQSGDLMTLRLQPVRGSSDALDELERHAAEAGFALAKPLSYCRTLKLSLEGSLEEILARMSRKTRPKIRHRTRDGIELRRLTDPGFIPQCREALRASFERTGGDAAAYDFEAIFELARTQPQRAAIFGIFLPSRPDVLLAFVVGRYGGGELAEYSAAGSLADPELRKLPFNYFLVWELIQWAHGCGARWLDLGGITPGGPDDPRASISEFKRHLCQNEVEISRELERRLQPVRAFVFDGLNHLRSLRSRPAARLAAGAAATTALFALLSFGLRAAGDPSNPALRQLIRQPRLPAIAVIGDSRAHVGISPSRIVTTLADEGLPGLDGYNYAVDGSDVLHHFSFVRHALEGGSKAPKVFIWTPNPLQFDGARVSNRLEMLTPGDIPGLFAAGAPFETILDLATMAFFPPYRQRPLVKHLLFEDYAGRAEIRSLPLQKRLLGLGYAQEPVSRRYHDAGDGQEPFNVLAWDDRFSRGEKGYLQDYEGLELSDWHFRLARELMREIRASGSLLVMVETPVAPYFQEHIATLPKHQDWRARMQKLAREEGAIFWSHANHYHDDHLFGDPGHMPEPTALDYSRFLADQLAADPTIRAALLKQARI